MCPSLFSTKLLGSFSPTEKKEEIWKGNYAIFFIVFMEPKPLIIPTIYREVLGANRCNVWLFISQGFPTYEVHFSNPRLFSHFTWWVLPLTCLHSKLFWKKGTAFMSAQCSSTSSKEHAKRSWFQTGSYFTGWGQRTIISGTERFKIH